MSKKTFSYSRDERLTGRKKIQRLFSSGAAFSLGPLRAFWLLENEGSGLFSGVGVSSRNFKKAVDRNRIKRLMRESLRLQKNKLSACLRERGECLHLFVLYTGRELPDYALIFEKMGKLLEKLAHLKDEKS